MIKRIEDYYYRIDNHLLGETEGIPTDKDVIELPQALKHQNRVNNMKIKAQFRLY